jgi:glycosyltransferase involved in cell wall biosynthesis
MELVCRSLQQQGDVVTIACGGNPDLRVTANSKWGWTEYLHEGIPVIRVVRNPHRAELADLYTRSDAERYDLWKRIFEQTAPDLVFTVGSGVALMGDIEMVAHAAEVPVVTTFIQPRQLCPKGPRIDARGKGCMVALDARICGECMVRSRGGFPGSYPVMKLLGTQRFAKWIGDGRLGTAIRLPQLVEGFVRRWEELLFAVSLFVAHSKAAVALLETNGVPTRQILFSPPGFEAVSTLPCRAEKMTGPVRFGFIGRLCREKGVHTLIRAWRLLAHDCPAELHFWGNPDQGEPEIVHALGRLRAEDRRVVFHGPFTRANTSSVYGNIDVLLVPSEWFDNCPFVISEAFAAGVPVVGTDFGGISSMIRHEVDGLLFPMGDRHALAAILARLASRPDYVTSLARNVRPPRDVRAHVEDLREVFSKLCANNAGRGPLADSK